MQPDSNPRVWNAVLDQVSPFGWYWTISAIEPIRDFSPVDRTVGDGYPVLVAKQQRPLPRDRPWIQPKTVESVTEFVDFFLRFTNVFHR